MMKRDVTPKTVRFWFYFLGYVKLSLTDGQRMTFGEWHRTDEGYSSRGYYLERQGDSIYLQADSAGSDCDGPLYTHWEGQCSIHDLPEIGALNREGNPITARFEKIQASQRDVYAEQMGY